MTPGRVFLSVVCRCVVVVWVAAYLAWTALSTATEGAPLEAAVAVQPRALTARDAAPRRAEPIAIEAADLRTGRALLEGNGSFPALHCSYDRFPSFLEYARAMERLGARFVVVRGRRIVGAWDLAQNQLQEAAVEPIFSPRARDYSGEPALRAVVQAAEQRFGEGAEIMMVVPRNLDAGLFGGIARALGQAGEPHDAYRELRGRYRPAADGGVQIELVSGLRQDGREVGFEMLFDLRAIAGLGAAAG